MTTKAQVKTQARTPAAPAAVRTHQPPAAVPEHEAERRDIAAQLESAARLGHSLGAVGVDGPAPPIIQRQEIPEEEEEELQMKREPAAIQRQELPEEEGEELMLKPGDQRVGPQGGQVPPDLEAAIRRARGGGQPLWGELQEQMSASLGHDFSGVRVHTDSEADALNQQLQAKAFTTGADIFFKGGAYDPASRGGRELIAHELSHVVQQSSGRVSGDGSGMTVRPAGDAFEQEADSVSVAVARFIDTSVQRQPPDEEEAQMREGGAIQTHIRGGSPVTGDGALETGIMRTRGSGQLIAGTTHKPMGHALKADFSDVRVQTDSQADVLNQQIQTKYFTTHPAICFKGGDNHPAPRDRRELRADELIRVVQRPSTNRGARRSAIAARRSGDEFEPHAQEAAGRVDYMRVARHTPHVGGRGRHGGGDRAATRTGEVQRSAAGQMRGMAWRHEGPINYNLWAGFGVDPKKVPGMEKKKPFGRWLFTDTAGLPEKMNCWEAVVLGHYLDGRSKDWVKRQVRGYPPSPALLKSLRPTGKPAEEWDPEDKIPVDTVISLGDKAEHVVIATGKTYEKSNSPEVLSLDHHYDNVMSEPLAGDKDFVKYRKNPVLLGVLT